jgi:hypothetical protein
MKIAELRPDLAEKIVLTCSVGHLGLKSKEVVDNEVVTIEEIKKIQGMQVMDAAIRNQDINVIKTVFKLVLTKFIQERFHSFADELT